MQGGAGRGAAVPGGAPGAVRAAAAVTLGVEEEFVLLDPATGATVLAAPELVRMLGGEPGVQQELMRIPGGDRDRGVHQPGRGRPRADPAAAARRGRRGISGLPGWWPPGSRRTARPGWPR